MTSLNRPDDHVIVLFGATGDLAKRMLLPGLYRLAGSGLLPARYRIIGSAPAAVALSDEGFRRHVRDAVTEFGTLPPTGALWDDFERRLSFAAADADDPAPLVAAIAAAEKEIGGNVKRLFHLAVPPPAFPSMIAMLGAANLTERTSVIVEKPFGSDLASAKRLNAAIHAVFDESQIFRIDHFLGKESIDNLLALRFGNGLFEPIWNREYIAYVQIDVPETLSIEGRAVFYEDTGAYRDMVVTHLLQVLGFIAMEPPTTLAARPLREERRKVFEAMRSVDLAHVVRGRYDGYLHEPGVSPTSTTETFVALRVEVDNWRWQGVPFHLRTGKCLAESRRVVTLGFHQPTLRMFDLDTLTLAPSGRNQLVIDFSDPGTIEEVFLAKEPGPTMRLGEAQMVFRYGESFDSANGLAGYERLLLDAMTGDQSLFTDAESIERLWEISAPVVENPPPLQSYPKGSWGPASIANIAAPYRWHLPAPLR
jgi:glucose-6-phosphate 1-dehydrogenase